MYFKGVFTLKLIEPFRAVPGRAQLVAPPRPPRPSPPAIRTELDQYLWNLATKQLNLLLGDASRPWSPRAPAGRPRAGAGDAPAGRQDGPMGAGDAPTPAPRGRAAPRRPAGLPSALAPHATTRDSQQETAKDRRRIQRRAHDVEKKRKLQTAQQTTRADGIKRQRAFRLRQHRATGPNVLLDGGVFVGPGAAWTFSSVDEWYAGSATDTVCQTAAAADDPGRHDLAVIVRACGLPCDGWGNHTLVIGVGVAAVAASASYTTSYTAYSYCYSFSDCYSYSYSWVPHFANARAPWPIARSHASGSKRSAARTRQLTHTVARAPNTLGRFYTH